MNVIIKLTERKCYNFKTHETFTLMYYNEAGIFNVCLSDKFSCTSRFPYIPKIVCLHLK